MFNSQMAATDETLGIEYIDGLYRYALVLTRNRSEAEDLVQETYIRAMGAFDRLREGSNVRGWLFAILRNLWFTELRKRRNGPHLVEGDANPGGMDSFSEDALSPQAWLESEEDARQVRCAISQLPREFQEVLVLREFEELSYQGIADTLGCPIGTVMSRLGRARAKLRVLLTQGQSRPPEFKGAAHFVRL